MARIFITGSADGLGQLAAKKLVAEGHRVVLHARNEERARHAISKVPGAETVLIADLSGIEETKNLAAQVNELGSFDTIIHNAGILNVPSNAKSKDDLPLLFAVNTLAPYILTTMINRPKRLVYLSSSMHRGGDASENQLTAILEGKKNPSYSDTKLHDLILALAVTRKWPDVISNAVDPGWVPTKMGGSSAPDSLEKGYETQVWLATSQDADALKSGRLLFHKKEVDFNKQAANQAIQEKLLAICEELSQVSL
ncbi:SDR family NAD(P)-dependent oxidoreductase [uncultured Draconibacterium sp.]|uniref:SDR family NAD(P)-dependent oxidoreductase n=1 Tax=uncultured Draconibacterium sp. TaxID=1573823 RepID=UPI0025CD7CC2|nr:SDR family NAD(P)-dependent oxidoreductase [uncultured Draconibacterium sp.]